jgi:hypothetical protein
VVAGLLDEVVEARAFATEDENAIGGEIEVGVVGGTTLVESDDPDVSFLHLLEGADEIGDSGDTNVFGGPGRGFGYGGGNGGAATLREENAVDSGSIGRSEEGPEIVGVFDAVERKEEAGPASCIGNEEVFDGEECPLTKVGDNALVRLGFGDAGELVARLDSDADAGGAGEGGEAIKLCIAALAGDGDAVEPTGAGPDGLFNGVEAIKNFHEFKFTGMAARGLVGQESEGAEA